MANSFLVAAVPKLRLASLRAAAPSSYVPMRALATTGAPAAGAAAPGTAHPPTRPLTDKERDFLERAIRVNQAGELGANLIYAGQYAIFRHDARLRPLIRHMWDQEVHHLATFNGLVARHRVRPTAMRPLWNVAGYALGLGTALLGEKAAMACTEAVETEIGGHYNDQLRALLGMMRADPALARSEELQALVRVVREFRDDELEHLDTAVEHGAKGAGGYELIFNAIRGGCKAAIWISSRI